MRKQDSEKAVPDSLMEPENPDYSSKSRGLNTENKSEISVQSSEESEHAMKVQEADQRMQESPAFQRAKKPREKGESAAYKSKVRTLSSMKGFYQEVASRNRKAGWKVKTFDNPVELARDSDEFVNYCLENEIIPTWNLFAVWMNCDPSTLYAEENLSSECSVILKKLRNRLFTVLEQFSLQTEGNPGSPIFHEKAQYGLSDQQPLDVNIHTDAQKQLSSREVQNIINLTPDEIHETD